MVLGSGVAARVETPHACSEPPQIPYRSLCGADRRRLRWRTAAGATPFMKVHDEFLRVSIGQGPLDRNCRSELESVGRHGAATRAVWGGVFTLLRGFVCRHQHHEPLC